MSTIGVKFHDEDIHNVFKKIQSPRKKIPRYNVKQILLKKAELTAKYKYNGHQTFGKAHYDPPEFQNYLKKGKAKGQLPPVKQTAKKEFIPSIPKPNLEKQKRPKKNFVKENIKNVSTLEPKLPAPRRVETPRGTVKDMAHLIQMIKIRDSDKYGKIPKYLCLRKMKWEKAESIRQRQRDALQKYKEKMGIGTMGMKENVYMLDKDLRHKLLFGLKENWNELFKQFLKLPVMNDTLTKIKRRTWLEKEMDQIEKDIKLIESHPYIYLERSENKTWEEILQEEIEKEKTEEEKEKEKQEKESKESPKEKDNDDGDVNEKESNIREDLGEAECKGECEECEEEAKNENV